MNIKEFEETYKNYKSDSIISIACDCHNHEHGVISMYKRYAKANIKRNMERHGKEEFICESCYKSLYNPMKVKAVVPKPDDIITVICVHPEHKGDRKRQIKWSAYKGVRQPENGQYEQLCGSCWQLHKKITQEQRDKISESLKGHQRTQESIEKQMETWYSNPENLKWAKELGSTYNDHYTNGMLGKHHSEETKKKMSDAKKGKKKTPEQKINMSVAQLKRQTEKPITDKTKDKIRNAVIDQYMNGFKPETHHLSGSYKSIKTGNVMYYKSSYELKSFIILDEDPNVINYFYEKICVDYYNPKKKSNAKYIVDLFVQYKDGSSSLIEIKPRKLVMKNEIVKAKIAGMEAKAEKMGISCIIWDEYVLFGSEGTEKKSREFTEWARNFKQD